LLEDLLLTLRLERYQFERSFFRNRGISIAVGTVLGASTLPFHRKSFAFFQKKVLSANFNQISLQGSLVQIQNLLLGQEPSATFNSASEHRSDSLNFSGAIGPTHFCKPWFD
jgi:hypothetical protein